MFPTKYSVYTYNYQNGLSTLPSPKPWKQTLVPLLLQFCMVNLYPRENGFE